MKNFHPFYGLFLKETGVFAFQLCYAVLKSRSTNFALKCRKGLFVMQSMEQTLHLSQGLHLSPSIVQSMKILQMNTGQLAEYMNDMAMENPTIEFDDFTIQEVRYKEWISKVPWLTVTQNRKDLQCHYDIAMLGGATTTLDTLSIFLRDQLARLHLSAPLEALCNYLSEMLDERGYLNAEDLNHLEQSGVPSDLLTQAVQTLQSLEPAGLAARSLSECLHLQLCRLKGDHALADLVATEYLEPLSKGHYHFIARQLNVSVEEVERIRQQLQGLHYNPIQEFEHAEPTHYVSPDAFIAEIDGSLQVMVNEWDLPSFHLSKTYVDLLAQPLDGETELYLREKIQHTQWLLQCVSRRRNTLEACLLALVAWQKEFFLSQSTFIRPLYQWQIAERIRVHPSTLSRTIRNKYLQCQQGTFPLSFFFSNHMGCTPAVSEMEIKAKLAQLISKEDPRIPFSDEKLRKDLEAQGIRIARRTVAKYRNDLGFLSSYVRKQSFSGR